MLRRGPGALVAIILGLTCSQSAGEPWVPPDESLTAEEYRQLGLPELGHHWNERERTEVRSLLLRLSDERPDQLPQFRSEFSGDVFAKIAYEEIDRRGILEGAFGSVPVGELKALDSEGLAQLVQSDSLERIDAPSSTGGRIFDRELVELPARRVARALVQRDELEEKLDEVENSTELPSVRVQEFVHQYRELLWASDQILVRLLANLAFFAIAERFTPDAKSDATSHLVAYVPRIAPLLSPEAREDLFKMVREIGATPGAGFELATLLDQP